LSDAAIMKNAAVRPFYCHKAPENRPFFTEIDGFFTKASASLSG